MSSLLCLPYSVMRDFTPRKDRCKPITHFRQCTICEKGHYCAATSVEQTPCASPASYAAKKGSQRCKECPPGHRCPSPSEYPVKCEMGSYSLEGPGVCHLCPPGYECLSISLAPQRACSQGEYSLLGHASCQKCPAGKPRLKIGH